jgi:hypothetical protein
MSAPNGKTLSNQEFYAGRSLDDTLGPKGSFAYDRALEFRRDPSQLTVLPGPRKISAAVVTDLPMNIVQVDDGSRYAFGDTGKFYKISTSNVVSSIANTLTSGSDGLLYRSDSDAIYMATANTLERYSPISGAPTFDQSYGVSKSIDTAATRTGGALTYTVPTTITETATALCSFTPDIEPFYSIKVKVVAKGTGDWTLTLHDGLNTVLATKTITNANLTNGALNEFVFASQVRGYVKPNARTYHFHLTSTVADGTAQVTTVSDLSTADFELWAYRLVSTRNGLHPIAQFLQYTLIGNGNYLAVWEPLTPGSPPNNEFERHRLTFPSGYEVCGIAPSDEFVVIACEKRSSTGNKDFQEGKLFIWDGISQTYNQIVNVTGGSPESIFTKDNYPYFYVNGALCAWFGGKNIVQIRPVANTSTDFTDITDNTHAYPNMMTVRDGLLHLGYPSYTNNTTIEFGVYTWGSYYKELPSSFGYSYVTSTMQTTPTDSSGGKKLGCVRNFGDELYIGWKDGTDYGIDLVDSNCEPAAVAKYRMRSFDAGMTRKKKRALKMAIDTKAVPANVTITPKYTLDDNSELSGTAMATGDTEIITPIKSPNNFKRITTGFDIATTGTGTATPTIYATTLLWNPLPEEKAM